MLYPRLFFSLLYYWICRLRQQVHRHQNLHRNKKNLRTGPEQEEFGHGPEQEEFGHGPDIRRFNPSTILGIVQAVYTTSHIASFLLLWGSTAMLLHTYSKKLGKVKFWTIISIPIASFLSIFVFVTPYVMQL